MTYLIFDTETTGLPRRYDALASDLDNWPRIVQLAWALCDENGNRLKTASSIIQPIGYQIPAGMIHGISHEQALREGKPASEVLNQFLFALLESNAAVCHNYDFDAPIVGAEFLRLGWKNALGGFPAYCTKEQTTNWCRIPAKGRNRGYKWPSLAELHRLCGYGEIPNAHDASADVDATANCFFHLLYTEPDVFRQPYISA
ncbi:MAG: 3'-5' exonuclease [Saprospiraceae bacterium]|nr:3'-5' exonuclease [Saprospiraceae bacterium]MCF8252148.1 3'-5' exonuclease [Saprospiraceae bacterium]MCF8282443.1 3'-5' exonuclease [Bacteroidales bacterium]MCF8313817.1 3'-5' exonuclease [Saprospiraceae bacterium]MCF8442523.1 3'-5' exonuclease [Saprospiraceae bacterium]